MMQLKKENFPPEGITISVTFMSDDYETILQAIATDADKSGILAHISNLLLLQALKLGAAE